MQLNQDVVKEALDRDGYAVVRSAFSVQEISRMRNEITDLLETAPPSRGFRNGRNFGPLSPTSRLGTQLLDGRVTCGGLAPRQIYVHCDTYNGWHVDGPPLSAAEFPPDAAWMYKAVLYLQDHTDRDGFSAVRGSHKQGGPKYARCHFSTRAGDLIVFHHSLYHAGRLPNVLLANFAWGLKRLQIVDDCGRQRMLGLTRFLSSTPAVRRLAVFILFATLEEVGAKFHGMYKAHGAPRKEFVA